MHYRPGVLEGLLEHGVRPRPDTPPETVRAFLNDLYRYELRRLRARLVAGEIAKADYAAHVVRLRGRYPLLSLPTRLWVSLEP